MIFLEVAIATEKGKEGNETLQSIGGGFLALKEGRGEGVKRVEGNIR